MQQNYESNLHLYMQSYKQFKIINIKLIKQKESYKK